MTNRIIRRLATFLGVGVMSSAAYLATMSFCIERLGTGVLGAAFAAFVAGTAISYAGNTWLTFAVRPSLATLGRFFAVTLFGLGANQLIAFALDRLGAHYLLIALAVFVIVPAINFVGHSVFTYSRVVG